MHAEGNTGDEELRGDDQMRIDSVWVKPFAVSLCKLLTN
jgi:hypothetical protein